MLNWRQKTVADLATNPESWILLGELFAEVESMIPPHLAIRRTANTKADVGLHTARWRMFITHLRPLVERQINNDGKLHNNRFQRYEFVRLKFTLCEGCGDKRRYLSYWPNHNQDARYMCITCNNPNPIQSTNEVDIPQVLPPEVIKVIKPRAGAAKRKRPPKTYQVIEQPKILPVVTPLPKVKETVVITPPVTEKPLSIHRPRPQPKSDPIEEAWVYVLTRLENNERSNQKLRRAMRLAFDMGLINEYHQMNLFRTYELGHLGYPLNEVLTNKILKTRAINWINLEMGSGAKILPPDLKRRNIWTPLIISSYAVAALVVINIGADGKLGMIDDLIEGLRKKRCHTQNTIIPKQPKEVKQRWKAPVKVVRNFVSRWINH